MALALVVLIPSVVLALTIVRRSDHISELATDPTPLLVSATLLETKEPIDTQMKLVVTDGLEISANVSVGLVTAVWVAAGDEITTGERLFDVDGVGRYGAHSPEPFYRNLEAGAVGADVVMLKNLLIGFGLLAEDANQSARFDNSTARAVGELNRIWSVPNTSMSFDPDLVVWLPTPQVAVAEMALVQGKPVPPAGEAIFKGGAQVLLSQLSLVNNENFVDGFVGGEVTDRTTGTLLGTLASPDGTVKLDPEGFNQWLAANDTAVPGASAESGVQIQVTLSRPSMVERQVIPAAAIMTDASGLTNCIWSQRNNSWEPLPVLVSSAGETGQVTLAEALPEGTQILANPIEVLERAVCPSR